MLNRLRLIKSVVFWAICLVLAGTFVPVSVANAPAKAPKNYQEGHFNAFLSTLSEEISAETVKQGALTQHAQQQPATKSKRPQASVSLAGTRGNSNVSANLPTQKAAETEDWSVIPLSQDSELPALPSAFKQNTVTTPDTATPTHTAVPIIVQVPAAALPNNLPPGQPSGIFEHIPLWLSVLCIFFFGSVGLCGLAIGLLLFKLLFWQPNRHPEDTPKAFNEIEKTDPGKKADKTVLPVALAQQAEAATVSTAIEASIEASLDALFPDTPAASPATPVASLPVLPPALPPTLPFVSLRPALAQKAARSASKLVQAPKPALKTKKHHQSPAAPVSTSPVPKIQKPSVLTTPSLFINPQVNQPGSSNPPTPSVVQTVYQAKQQASQPLLQAMPLLQVSETGSLAAEVKYPEAEAEHSFAAMPQKALHQYLQNPSRLVTEVLAEFDRLNC